MLLGIDDGQMQYPHEPLNARSVHHDPVIPEAVSDRSAPPGRMR